MAPDENKVDGAVKDSIIRAGMQLAQAPPGEEIVISGLSGYFPDSVGVYELRDNLFNKVDMVTEEGRRWKLDHPEIPQRLGKVFKEDQFDASFFGVHYKQAETMDPMCRLLLERTYEAIVDAGVIPSSLKGKRIGVFIGVCYSVSEKTWLYEKMDSKGLGITGCSIAMFANRISYWLGIIGPSYTVDSACSSSMYTLEHAYRAIRDGLCDAAIVGGSNICFHPYGTLQFFRLGVLSPHGKCKSFDRDANGFARSETICVVFLQKARDAKRIYTKIVHAQTNCDGYKDKGITYPSGEAQKQLLQQLYQECSVNPTSVDYIEAHGTGTKAGDPEELNTLTEIFCKERKAPLPIGSVKSNIGHSEPAAGLCSITKVIIAMETGFVPPNLHYYHPREGIEGLEDGRLQVVTEKYPLNCRLAGASAFGFGGANAHVLLQWNEKTKINGGVPTDCLPRLIVASGRNEEAVDVILKDFESRPVDAEFVALMQDLQSEEIAGHMYRGYTLLKQNDKNIRNIQYCKGTKRPVWFVFTGIGSQWSGMAKALLNIPIFAAAIEKCQQALKPLSVDLYSIITNKDPGIFDNILNCFVGIAACQVGLVDILRAVDITADGVIGHSVGELGCSYADGCFTAEQAVLAAYYSGRAVMEAKLGKGSMTVVGMKAEEVKKFCPSDIEVACHYGPDMCVLSGPVDVMKKFVGTLKQRDVFAEEMNCANVPCHSRHIAKTGPALLKYLKQVIPSAKPRSHKWVSSSVPQRAWSTSLATHSSAEYHTNNLLSPVLFQEALQHIPTNAITIEIAPHSLLQAVLHQFLAKTIANVAIMQRGHPDCMELLLIALGKLFELGLQPKLTKIYPPVEYPVSRGTPMISPLVRWNHSINWYVPKYEHELQENKWANEKHVTVSLKEEDLEYLSGHVIDGRNLYPATGYIVLVWEFLLGHTDMSIVFENISFHRATNIPKEGNIKFVITMHKASGRFEVFEGGAAVVTGSVRTFRNSDEMTFLPPPEHSSSNNLIELNSRDIYKELRLHGYNYQGLFRSLVSMDGHGKTGKIRWSNNWCAFMDNLLQVKIITCDSRGLFVPTSIEKLTIDTKKHSAVVSESEDGVLPVQIYQEVDIVRSGGVEVRGLKASGIARRKPLGTPVLEKYMFVPNAEPENLDLHSALRVCVHMMMENQSGIQVKVDELHHPGHHPLSPTVALILEDLPLIQADITLLGDAANPALEGLEITGFQIDDLQLKTEKDCNLVITSHILSQPEIFQAAVGALAEGAFILDREEPDAEIVVNGGCFGMQIVFEKTFKDERLVLLKKVIASTIQY